MQVTCRKTEIFQTEEETKETKKNKTAGRIAITAGKTLLKSKCQRGWEGGREALLYMLGVNVGSKEPDSDSIKCLGLLMSDILLN